MSLGALISPNGQTGKAISETEYTILKTCLELYRSDDRQLHAIAETLAYIKEPQPETRTLGKYLNFLVDNLGDHIEEFEGMVLQSHGEPVLIREGNHADTAADLVKVLCMGGWFAKWIALQIQTIAAGNPPPSPLQLMQSLASDLDQFELALITAQQMYEQHRDLVVSNEVASAQPA